MNHKIGRFNTCFSIFVFLTTISPAPMSSEAWRTADPDTLPIDDTALEAYQRLCEESGAEACLVAYDGQIILEWYGDAYEEPVYTMSSVKSWTALLVGIAIRDGHIAGVDDPVSRFLPEWRAGAAEGVTWRHLLSMTAGLDTRNGNDGPRRSIGFVSDKYSYLVAMPLDHPPGTSWAYSNESAQLLSPLLQRAVGVPLGEYAREVLFEPLGMDDTSLHEYPPGQFWTYADAETTLRDFARIGQLVLDGGRVGKTPVVPTEWIEACLTPGTINSKYGWLWWLHYRDERSLFEKIGSVLFGSRNEERVSFAVATHGHRYTDCYVIPGDRLVAARIQNSPSPEGSRSYHREEALEILSSILP